MFRTLAAFAFMSACIWRSSFPTVRLCSCGIELPPHETSDRCLMCRLDHQPEQEDSIPLRFFIECNCGYLGMLTVEWPDSFGEPAGNPLRTLCPACQYTHEVMIQ